jgi:hypothetical protein
VSALLAADSLDALRASFPGGEDVEVGGAPAYRFGSASPELGTETLILPLGPQTLTLTVSTTDPDVEVEAAAHLLAEAALAGGATGSSPASSTSPGSLSASPGPAASLAVGAWCEGLTAEAVSAAVGVEVTALPNQTIEGSCGWIGGPIGEEIAVEINRLDASTLEDLAASFGGTPVDGLPFAAWWAPEFEVLHALAGDTAFHVYIASGGLLDEADAKARAIALAQAFVASW